MATYIIRAGQTGPVKIGRADDPRERMSDLQTGHPDELVMLRVVDTQFDCEAAFHERYAEQRIRGEWFNFVPDMLSFVPSVPAPEPAIHDIVQRARAEVLAEVASLIERIWPSYRGWNTKRDFAKRLASLLQCKRSRAHNLIYGRSRVIEYHELVGLRAIARKLAKEQPKQPENDLFTPDRDSLASAHESENYWRGR